MRRSRRAFPGIGIDCESVIVDRNFRRLLPTPVTVRVDSPDIWHCVALGSATRHSFYVRLENTADEPLFYIDYGAIVVVPEILVEPPLKRQRGGRNPAAGRKPRSYRISAQAQNPGNGRVCDARLRSKIEVQGYLENSTGIRFTLPDEPAFKGSASVLCRVE